MCIAILCYGKPNALHLRLTNNKFSLILMANGLTIIKYKFLIITQ